MSPDDYNKVVIPTKIDIVGNKKGTLLPVSADLNSDVLTFIYNSTPHYHIDLARTVMRLEVQLVNDKGEVIPAPREVYTLPSILTSIFSSRQTTLQTEIFKSGDHYQYLGYFRDFFTMRTAFKETFAYDTNGYYDTKAQRAKIAGAFAKSDNKKFYVIGYLDQPPFNISAGKLLPPSVPLKIEFQRARDKFFIMDHKKTATGNPNDATLEELNAKFVILNAQIDLLCLELNDKLNSALETKLSNNNIAFDYNDCKVNTFVLSKDIEEIQTTALSVGMQPSRVLIFLTDQKRYMGQYSLNPYKFQLFNLRRIQLLRNGVQFDQEYNVNFNEEKSYNRNSLNIYFRLLNFLGQDKTTSCGISFKQFTDDMCCFPFDLTPGLNAYDHKMTQLVQPGDISVKLEFGKPLSENLVLIYYSEYKNSFENDKSRNVQTI